MAKKQRLRDRVAIVTGASSGIGRATAVALARAGANVVLAARNVAALEQVAHEIESFESPALIVPLDVTQRDQVQRMVEATLTRWGHVDILIANAGAYVRSRVVTLTVEEVERAMAVNFYGALYGVLAVLPHMLAQQGGHVVLVNTMDAKKPIPLDAPYISSKSALAGFGDVLRQELHGTGVYVTSVFPGRVDTPMIAHLRVPWISAKMPADEVARAIVHSIYRREPEVILPPTAKALIYLNTFFPQLADWAARVLHLEGWEDETGYAQHPARAENTSGGDT